MADPALLARARLLVEAADSAAAAVSSIGQSQKSPSNSPKKVAMSSNLNIDTNRASSIDIQQSSSMLMQMQGAEGSSTTSPISSPSRSSMNRSPSKMGGGNSYQHPSQTLKVSVIRGSSLVSCVSGVDIRNYLRRDSKIDIEGQEYVVKTKSNAEWSGHRFEITTDYAGDTKLDAVLFIKDTLRRPMKKKAEAIPIPSHDISDAIKGLEQMVIPTFAMNRNQSKRESYGNNNGSGGYVYNGNSGNNGNGSGSGGYSKQHASPGARSPHKSPSKNYSSANSPASTSINNNGTNGNNGNNGDGSYNKYSNTHGSPPKRDEGMSSVLSEMVSFHTNPDLYSYTNTISDSRENHLINQRKLAKQRAFMKSKEIKEAVKEKEQKEKELKEAKREAMERKASELQQRTRRRVFQLKKEQAERLEREEREKQDDLRKVARGKQYADSEEYKDKMEFLRKETAERMRRKRHQERQEKARESQERKKKLSAISNSRRQQDMTTPRGFRPKLLTMVTQHRKLRQEEEDKERREVENIACGIHMREADDDQRQHREDEYGDMGDMGTKGGVRDADGYYDYTDHDGNDGNNGNGGNNGNDDDGEEVLFQPMDLQQLSLNPHTGATGANTSSNSSHHHHQQQQYHPNPATSVNINHSKNAYGISKPKSNIPRRAPAPPRGVSPIALPATTTTTTTTTTPLAWEGTNEGVGLSAHARAHHSTRIHSNNNNGNNGIANQRAGPVSGKTDDDDDDDDEWSDDSLSRATPERVNREIDDMSRSSKEYPLTGAGPSHNTLTHNNASGTLVGTLDSAADDISAITFDLSPSRGGRGGTDKGQSKTRAGLLRHGKNSYTSTLDVSSEGGPGYSQAYGLNNSAFGKPPLPRKSKFRPLKPIPLSTGYIEVKREVSIQDTREAEWK